MTSDKNENLRRKRMLSAGYITFPDAQKIIYNDGEMIQWVEEEDTGIYSIHMADFDKELEYAIFELDDLIKTFKEFGINLTKEQ